MANRELYFKIERLNQADIVIEEKTPHLISGEVKVSRDDKYRRTCKFDLSEELPENWLLDLWRLWYGRKVNGVIEYDSLGVFIPLDPVETQDGTGKVTSYQGVDKTKWLVDSIGDAPTSFTQNQTLKEVAIEHLDAIGETQRNLVDLPYTLNTNYTFSEYREAEHTLRTLVDSFTVDFFYDRNGYATLLELPTPNERPVAYEFEDGEASIYTQSKKKIQTSDYWNKVIVVGGNADSDTFRSIKLDYSNDVLSEEVANRNGAVTKSLFEGGGHGRQGQDLLVPDGIDNIGSVIIKVNNPNGTIQPITVLAYSSVELFNADSWFAPTNARQTGVVDIPANSTGEYEAVFNEPFTVFPGESIFYVLIADQSGSGKGGPFLNIYMDDTTSQYADGQRYENYYGGAGGTVDLTAVPGDLYFVAKAYVPGENRRRITRYFKDEAATSQDQTDALAVKYLDEGIRIPSTISLQSFPITSLEVKDIIIKDGVKYEVLEFNIPLGLGLQTITAGKVL